MLNNEDFKKSVAIPYFKDIYKDLYKACDQAEKIKGIDMVTLLQVST